MVLESDRSFYYFDRDYRKVREPLTLEAVGLWY